MHTVPCAAGDGIGPELVGAAREAVSAAGPSERVEWLDVRLGRDYGGEFLPEETLAAAERHRVLFKGPVTIPPGDLSCYTEARGRRFTSPNNAMRQLFGLYANVRPARGGGVDLVVVRENTEDVYTGIEEAFGEGEDYAVHLTKIISRRASRAVAEAAFAVARAKGRRRVTAVHKANVCKRSDGLFLDTAREVAAQHPDIDFDDHLADSLLARLVSRPGDFDVLLCPNLFGDLLSDMAGGLVGSLGVLPSGQYGAGGMAVFEPAHGSAPDIAGQGVANPASQMRCGVMLLEHLGEVDAARRLDAAVDAALADPSARTRDLGGEASTSDFVSAVCSRLV